MSISKCFSILFVKNKKSLVYLLLFLVFLLSIDDFALASDLSQTQSEEKNWVVEALYLFLGMIGSILALLTMLIGVFLRPEWTSGSAIGLNTQLKTMWIMISNIVYFIFAGIFIVIAFMNIIGRGGDNYELKKALPKFIVGVLIVPFSRFFVQFTLSLSNIMTTAILSLPYDIFPELKIGDSVMEICEKGYKINLSATGSNIISCDGGDKPVLKTLNEIIKAEDNGGLYQIMMIYTYGVMKIDAKGKLFSQEIIKGITDLSKLTAKAVFDILFVLVYCILLVALFLAFVSRSVMLWFYTMFSPAFGLIHYFGKGKDGLGSGVIKKFNLKEFIALAFVPVYVAGALTFGLVFLYTTGKGFSSDATVGADKIFRFEGDKLIIKGSVPLSFDAILTKSQQENEVKKIFGDFKGVVGTMLLQMLGLAVLWMAVMAALKQSSITESITSPIASFGDQIGKLVSKAPTYAPIFPGGISPEGLKRIGSMPITSIEKRLSDSISPFQEKFDKVFGIGTIPLRDINEIRAKWSDGNITELELPEIQAKLRRMAETYGTNFKQYQDLVKEFNEAMRKSSDSNIRELAKNSNNLFKNGKLTEDGVRLLFDTPKDKSSSVEAINSGRPERVFNPQSPIIQTNQPISTSPFPGITKIQSGNNITIHITEYSKDGKEIGKVSLNVTSGKVDNIGELERVLKTHSGKYNEEQFKKLLTYIGITNKDQIERLIKSYFNE